MNIRELRHHYLISAKSTEIAAILESAFEEDDREGSMFDDIGFSQFCPEDSPENIREAWIDYRAYHYALEVNYGQ